MSRFGRFLDAAATKVENGVVKSLVSRTDRNFANAYTGLKPSPLATGLGIGAAGVYGAWQYGSIQSDARVNSNVEYGRQAPIMSGDGVGKSNAPRMGATGDLVFGLNSMRRG